MKAKNLTEETAYALLRKTAMNENKKIAEIAQSVITAAELLRNDADKRLRIGFIPLCDATALIVAVDKGFCAAEGLDVELVREVSWSNVRDKLNIGLFDAAHLIAPVAIASSLGLGHVKVPIVAPFALGVNGNAITVSPALYARARAAADGDLADPMVSARALARVVAARKRKGQEPLTFGMTFPVLDAQLSSALLDGGRRRRSGRGRAARRAAAALHGREPRQQACRRVLRRRAVEFGRGRSRHRLHPAFRVGDSRRAPPRRCSACASRWAQENPDVLAAAGARARPRRRLRRGRRATATRSCAILAAPNRIGVAADVIRRTLDGRLKVSPDGAYARATRYLLVGRDGAARPDPVAGRLALRARWCAGARRRCRERLCRGRDAVFRPDLYDALGAPPAPAGGRTKRPDRGLRRTALSTPATSRVISRWRIRRVPVPESQLPIFVHCTIINSCASRHAA